MLFRFTASNFIRASSNLRIKFCCKTWRLTIVLHGLYKILNRSTSLNRLIESLPRQFHQDLLGLQADILHEVAFASQNPFKKIRPKKNFFVKFDPSLHVLLSLKTDLFRSNYFLL